MFPYKIKAKLAPLIPIFLASHQDIQDAWNLKFQQAYGRTDFVWQQTDAPYTIFRLSDSVLKNLLNGTI